MQIQDTDYSILMNAQKQLSTLLFAHSLYIKATKHQLTDHTRTQCENHLQMLTVQSSLVISDTLPTAQHNVMQGTHCVTPLALQLHMF